MATKISSSAISSSAESSLDRKISNGSGRTGEEGDQAAWDALRSRACKLFLTDPDSVVYLYFLASNSLSALISQYHGLLCECIVLAESISSQVTTDRDTEIDLAQKKEALGTTVTALRRGGSAGIGTTLKTAAASYANAVAKTSSRKKKMERGPSSPRTLRTLAEEASRIGSDIILQISYMTQASSRLEVALKEAARETILPHMASILRRTDLSPTEEALAIATSAASYEMLDLKRSTTFLIHTGRNHPVSLSVEASGTTVRFRDSAGISVNPALFMVSSGCQVLAGTQSTSVSSVGSESLELAEDLGPITSAIVRTSAQQKLYDFIMGTLLTMKITGIRGASNSVRKTSVRAMSRPDSYRVVKELSALAVMFAPLSAEAARSAEILGVEVSEPQAYLDAISTFDPGVPKASVSAVDSILDKMRGLGVDIAVSRLLRSEVEVLGTAPVGEVRSATKTAFAVSQLMDAITPSTSLG